MRIAYGIHGHGRGHATRAWAVLPALARQHEIRVFAGGDAFEMLSQAFPVDRVPTLGFEYRDGMRSHWRTLQRNVPLVADLVGVGPTTRKVVQQLRELAPDVVLCDCEPFTFRAAQLLRIPRIAFDHFGIMVRCKVAMPVRDWLESLVDRTVYQLLFGAPERALVSSFFGAPTRSSGIRMVGTLLRAQARTLRPSDGGHLLAYFNKGAVQLTAPMMRALEGVGVEVRLYGAGREGREGNLVFRAPGDLPFLRDLASCRAVLSTAGNQLVGEAMHLGKPLLVVPEQTVEQRMNAAAIARLGIGEWVSADRLTSDCIQRFLANAGHYSEIARQSARDGRDEAVEMLERWIAELARAKRQRPMLREAAA
ncbi:MAG TPA: glycosyltransferase family protein [Polyangiaceae bacterium]|jgi:uncharacterized protein (TIGR00661 family)